MAIKEYGKFEAYNYLEDNPNNNISTTKLNTSYDTENKDDLLKLSIMHKSSGQSIENSIYLCSDFVDELIYSLVQFRQDVKSIQFDRENKK